MTMHPILRILRLLRPYWQAIAQSTAAGIVIMLLSIPGPYLTSVLIDDVYPHGDFSLLTPVLILGAALSVGLGLTGFLSGHFGQCVGARMGLDLQARFYRHLQSLDFSFFDHRETGEILSRFRDLQGSVTGVIGTINTLILNGLQLLIFPPILLWINWRLALISLAVLPFDSLIVCLTRKPLQTLTRKTAESAAALSARTFESLAGIRTVQALGLESAFFRQHWGLFVRIADLQVRSSLFSGGVGFLTTALRAGGTLAYGWYGWTEVLRGHLSLGSFMAFSAYVGYLYGPLQNLIGLVPQVATALVHTNRFFEIYDLSPAIQDRPDAPPLPHVRGEIAFHDVSFAYNGRSMALRNVTLTIPHRATFALVGRSGSGKSTLAKLIPRFYDPDEGRVTLDGTDVRRCRLTSLRRQVGFAAQGSALFQGSVLENITFGRDVPMADVEDAARSAHIHAFIAGLPNGYDTPVGEGGAQLSEGQKQRIALTRVLLLNAPILILDEPTAALDPESEFHVQEAIRAARQGRTTLIIAHRLSTIRSADEIVVLENGQVAEQGPHDLLLAQGGVYADLHARTARI